MATLRSDRRLFVTADRSRVVEEGDPAAAFVLVGPSSLIEADDVARYKLTHDGRGHVVLPSEEKPKPAPRPRPKSEPEPVVEVEAEVEAEPEAPVRRTTTTTRRRPAADKE